jgi:hypothetical protein
MSSFMRQCDRFEGCSVSQCPLDPDMPLRTVHPKDPKKTCQAHLRDRLEIQETARKAGMVLPGLTAAESQRLDGGESLEMILAEWDKRREVKQRQGNRLQAIKRGSGAYAMSAGGYV